MSGMSDVKVLFFGVDIESVEGFVERNEWRGIPYEFMSTKKMATELLKAADPKKHIYVIVTLVGWATKAWAVEVVEGFRDKGFIVL